MSNSETYPNAYLNISLYYAMFAKNIITELVTIL